VRKFRHFWIIYSAVPRHPIMAWRIYRVMEVIGEAVRSGNVEQWIKDHPVGDGRSSG